MGLGGGEKGDQGLNAGRAERSALEDFASAFDGDGVDLKRGFR